MEKRFALLAAIGLAGCWDDDEPGPTSEPTTPGAPDAGPVAAGVDGVEDLSPEDGWTVHMPPFEVPPGTEVTDCYFNAVPDLDEGRDVWIDRIKVGQRPGSHHMNIFRVNTVIALYGEPGEVVHDGECKNLPNWADWPLVANSQDSREGAPPFEWQLPDGVAHRFRPGEMLMLQTHYVNSTDQPSPNGGEVKVNFYRTQHPSPLELGTLFARQDKIRICESDPVVGFSGHCTLPSDVPLHLAAANGHFHSRGTRVAMYTWDGRTMSTPPAQDRFYESLEWDEPPMATGLDETMPIGGGVWWTCEYEWSEPSVGCDEVNERDDQQADDCCYVFGNSAEAAEHCNVFVYYWPKVDPTTIFCD